MSRPLTPIGGGLNESIARTEQPAGSYSDGANVRGIDPKTGKFVWGAQRAGLTAEGVELPGGSHARHFVTASKLVAAREWQALGITSIEGAEPSQVGLDWSTRLDDRVLDVALGVDGQGYFLLASGDVAVVNRRGREVERIPSAVPNGFGTVPRVFASADASVYTAASRSEEFDGGAGRVFRWVRSVEGVWELAGTSIVETSISTFIEGFGVLYVHEDAPEDENGELPLPALTRIPVPFMGDPMWRQTVVPRPCHGLSLNANGQVFVSCPSNESRDEGGGVLFTARNVGWTPNELPTFEIGNVWSWIDALSANDEGDTLNDGDPVVRLRDRRFAPSSIAELDEDIPVRELTRSSSGIFEEPTWDSQAFGGAGGVRFDEGTAMVSLPHATLAGGPEQQALIPAIFPSWTAVALVEFTEEQGLSTAVRRLLSQRTTVPLQPDWIVSVNGLDVRLTDGVRTTQAATTSAIARTALVTFQHFGQGQRVEVRVNGTPVLPNETFSEITQGGEYFIGNSPVPIDGPFTVVGGGRPNSVNLAQHQSVRLFWAGTNLEDGKLRRLIDGSPESGAVVFASALPNQASIVIDLGVAMNFDSLSFWFSQDVNDPVNSIEVEITNDSTFSALDLQFFVTLPSSTGSRRVQRELDDPSGNPYRYIRLTARDGALSFTQFQIHQQDTLDAAKGAAFSLAEFVTLRNTAPAERDLLEGYVAHRWGIAHTLDTGHPFFGAGNFPPALGTAASEQDAAALAAQLNSPLPILAKYGTNGVPLAVYTGAGVGGGAAVQGAQVFAVGEPRPGAESATPDYGTVLTRFGDDSRALTRQAGMPDTVFTVDREPVAIEAGPCASLFVASDFRLRRINGTTLVEDWALPSQPLRAIPAGAQIDQTLQGGACGPEFLYQASADVEGARRIDVMGQVDTGREAGRDTELLVVTSSGDVVRQVDAGWETVGVGALTGSRPASATLYGNTIFADGRRYRVYNHALQQLRDFEEAVSGQFPERCDLIAAYRGRLVLAGGDNAFTIYQSEHGDPFNFDYGPEVQTISQAIAGTTASQGRVPEQITALMPWKDDLLYIGTTESLWVITGDLADGGRLDHVDKSQGVARGYAWCESSRGIYYFSGRGGVMLIGGNGVQLVSGAIQRRLEEIDLRTNRIELTYNWIDRCVHVNVLPRDLEGTSMHFTYEEPTGTWHPDSFEDYSMTASESVTGDNAEERRMLIGMADGMVYRWDQYADDDAGTPVKSRALVGPLLPGTAGAEARLTGVYGQLASDQDRILVGAGATNSADVTPRLEDWQELSEGRGLGLGFNASGPAVFIEVRGLGKAWAAHEMRVDLESEGKTRTTR